jgi:glutamate-1-semialdehyde 2,1-aminomutase
MPTERLTRFRAKLQQEYERRFPASKAWYERGGALLDHTSHAIRWNEPFMPVARRTRGAIVEDLDGNEHLDYWQGHFANILGHNPAVVLDALSETLADGRGLQSGMVHEIEEEVASVIASRTGTESVRLTTSGSLGTFYATLLSRAFTGRRIVLKVSGGWHGSQPFGLKGVSDRDGSFERIESEGLSKSTDAEIVLTRFNDVEMLRQRFAEFGDRLACFVVEPILGAGGGMIGTREFLAEARRLTIQHGALLLCDEIITGFRFRAGDLSSSLGIRPDLLILGKILGGGMPVAAVAGRRDILDLATRSNGRVKFEGGTYSAHELSLVGARAVMQHLIDNESDIYPELARKGDVLRAGLKRVAADAGIRFHVPEAPLGDVARGSLVFAHALEGDGPEPTCPEDVAAQAHSFIDERLMKATLLLQLVSSRTGIGSVSTSHTDEDLERTLTALAAGLDRFVRADLA